MKDLIKQQGITWQCTICGEVFNRVENAVFHDFKKHRNESTSRVAGERFMHHPIRIAEATK